MRLSSQLIILLVNSIKYLSLIFLFELEQPKNFLIHNQHQNLLSKDTSNAWNFFATTLVPSPNSDTEAQNRGREPVVGEEELGSKDFEDLKFREMWFVPWWWWCCAGDVSRNVRCPDSESTSVATARVLTLIKSARLYAQTFDGNYLFKII